ncbi:hypothetical protein M744_03895 [Synechococcus elongatus UTEX 2973]|nr:hypothetical protein M744_03895 [Synechococcus elongatus UTEX 2973]
MDDRGRHTERALGSCDFNLASCPLWLLYSPLRARLRAPVVFLGTAIAVEAVYDRKVIFNLFFQI